MWHACEPQSLLPLPWLSLRSSLDATRTLQLQLLSLGRPYCYCLLVIPTAPQSSSQFQAVKTQPTSRRGLASQPLVGCSLNPWRAHLPWSAPSPVYTLLVAFIWSVNVGREYWSGWLLITNRNCPTNFDSTATAQPTLTQSQLPNQL